MRSFILGIVIVMAVPEYAVGQRGDRSGRSETGRTAVPREEAVQAASAMQADRRAEASGETFSRAPRDEKSDDAAQSRAGRERRNTSGGAEAVRGRWSDERQRAAPARTSGTNSTRISRRPSSISTLNPGFLSPLNPGFLSPLNPGFLSPLNSGFRPIPDREHRRPGQEGDYRPPHRRPYGGANIVFVPYAAPVVVEREVVDEPALAPVIVEQPSLARLILDIHPSTAQVFADGYYIGIPEDFRLEDGGAVLEPGPHRIDILARDHEPVGFDVNLARGQSARLRHTLRPTMSAPQPAPDDAVKAPTAVKQPATFYLIPGCYIGNVPPKEANLPATCDIARAMSFQY
jgi:hypothetical protein